MGCAVRSAVMRGRRGMWSIMFVPVLVWGCGSDSGGAVTGPIAGGMAVQETALVSDQAGQAPTVDPNLVNPWGIASSPTGPFWVSDNGTGVSTLYNGSGQRFPVGSPLVVTIPPPAGSAPDTTAAPTGMVFNSSGEFVVHEGGKSGPSLFVFATEDGTVSGWAQTVDPGAAILTVDNSASDAVYKGLALAANGSANLLYATDFHAAHVDVFDGQFGPVSMPGGFTDPLLPAGFAPFGIASIGDKLYVTYAKQDADQHDDVKGEGNGFVDEFDPSGVLLRRFASRGVLNSPWGVVQAPAGFGTLGNAILVGNFGDGRISAFARSDAHFLGQLTVGGVPLSIDGLWGLEFGNGASAGDANALFFTAGPGDESHGLFGMVRAVGM